MDLLSNFRLHIAILSIVGGVIAATFFHSISFVMVFLVFLLYALFPLTSWVRVKPQRLSESNQSYSICSFNIEWNAAEHKNTLEYIKLSSSDILVLQEVTAALKATINQYTDNYPYQYGEGHSHVMVLSKHELKFVEYLPWPGKFQHRAIHVTCELAGHALHIIAIHMQVTRSWRELATRDQQIATLVNYLKNIEAPVIVVGDFNAGTASNVLREIEDVSGFCNRESLLNYRATWPARAGHLGIQLDHFFYKNVELAKPEIGPVLDSDHRPICSKFSFL